MQFRNIFLLFIFLSAGFSTVVAQEVPALMEKGKALLEVNKTDSAVACFEKVLVLDVNNYDALVLLCNYHFLTGKMELNSIEKVHSSYTSPTRMQEANYMEGLKRVYELYYSKAEKYLVQAYLLRRNDHLDDLAGQIADFKVRIGIRTPRNSKPWLIKKLLP
ncbi:MAG TPA: hypothetical protein VFP20_05595 [Bacteroidales bacterium]|nr:hypothetical protein [Bacteroidales bacterium]